MGGVRVRKKKTLTLPSPASGRGVERGAAQVKSADGPLLPLAGEGWDEGLLLPFPHPAHPFFSIQAWQAPFARSRTRPI